MRSADARCAGIECPDRVARRVQTMLNIVEPRESVKARYLFAKDHDRSSCLDKPKPGWKEVSLVLFALPLPRRAEGLTGS
jgi:hypothetical protein